MQRQKRQARAKARAKSNRLARQGVPFTHSKWHMLSYWKGPGSPQRLTPGEVQSNRRLARFADPAGHIHGFERGSI